KPGSLKRQARTRTAVRPPFALPALAVTVAATLGAIATPANAFVASASIDQRTATLNLAGPFNRMTVSVDGGLVVHDPADAVFDRTHGPTALGNTHPPGQT